MERGERLNGKDRKRELGRERENETERKMEWEREEEKNSLERKRVWEVVKGWTSRRTSGAKEKYNKKQSEEGTVETHCSDDMQWHKNTASGT
jgi:hypothetical protein